MLFLYFFLWSCCIKVLFCQYFSNLGETDGNFDLSMMSFYDRNNNDMSSFSPKTYHCSKGSHNIWVLGGESICDKSHITKIVFNLPQLPTQPYFSIRIKLRFFKIDLWMGAKVSFLFRSKDGSCENQFFEKKYSFSILLPNRICSNGYDDDVNIDETLTSCIEKTDNVLIIYISEFSSENSAFGIRDFQLYINYCHGSCKSCSGAADNMCTSCYDGYFLDGNNKCTSCSPSCATCVNAATLCTSCDANNLKYFYTNNCYNECPNLTYKYMDSVNCIDNCPNNYYVYKDKICVDSCPSGTFYYKKDCLEACPSGFFRDSNYCVDSCPAGKVIYVDECLENCPNDTFLNMNLCLASCPEEMVSYDYICLYECPSGFVIFEKKCLSECPENTMLYYKECLQECPENTYINSFEKKCEDECPASMYSLDFVCYYACPGNLLKYINTCVNECPTELFLSGNECITQCNPKFYVNNKTCLSVCPKYALFDNKTCINTEVCPLDTFELNKICYSLCPSPYLNFENKCISECPQYYNQSNHTCVLGCLEYKFNGSCISSCPDGYYQIKKNLTCGVCSNLCKTCYGPNDNQCLSCEDNRFFDGNFSTCVETCPNYYFDDELSRKCSKCSEDCIKCKNFNYCLECNNFSLLVDNKCKKINEIQLKLVELHNPYKFRLDLSEKWDYFLENLEKFLKDFSIQNFVHNQDYDYFIKTNINMSYLNLSLNYISKRRIDINKNYILKLWFYGNDNETNSSFHNYIDQNISTILKNVDILCEEKEFFSEITNKCLPKDQISIFLAYTPDPLKYRLDFSNSFPNYSQKILLSSITIESFSENEFNYSLYAVESSKMLFEISISPKKAIINHPTLTYFLNISDNFLMQNNLYMLSKSAKISMKIYYPMSDSEKETAASLSEQSKVGTSVAQGSGYISTLFSSSLFMQGLMLVEMIFCMKFININYPTNVLQLFESSKNNNPTLIFHVTFGNDSLDNSVLPQSFRTYNVSPYFLDNIGENLCQICGILIFAIFFIYITPYHVENKKKHGVCMKILIFFRNTLVWEACLFFILLNIQKIFFYLACSWQFPPINSANALINLLIASGVGTIAILWIFHLCFKIKVCHDFKEKIVLSKSVSFSESQNIINSNKLEHSNSSILCTPKIIESPEKQKIIEHNNSSILCAPPKLMDTPEKQKNTKFFNNFGKKNCVVPYEEQPSIQSPTPLDLNKDGNSGPLNSITPTKMSKKNDKKNLKNYFVRLKNYLFHPKNKEVFLKRYEVLHLEYLSTSIFSKYYPFIYYIRQCLISAFVVAFVDYPFFVIFSINFLNISFILYTIMARPFTTIYSYVVSIINELITETALFSGLMIAIYDKLGLYNYEERLKMGWVILFANTCLLYWIIFTGISRPVFQAVYLYYKKKKELNKVHSF